VDDKDYQVPFKFTGKLNKLTLKLDRPQLTPAEITLLEQEGQRNNRASVESGFSLLLAKNLDPGFGGRTHIEECWQARRVAQMSCRDHPVSARLRSEI
jgi:hypothetical protein